MERELTPTEVFMKAYKEGKPKSQQKLADDGYYTFRK